MDAQRERIRKLDAQANTYEKKRHEEGKREANDGAVESHSLALDAQGKRKW